MMSFVSDVQVHRPIHLHSELEAERPGEKTEGGRGLPPSDWHELFRPNFLIKTLISGPNL